MNSIFFQSRVIPSVFIVLWVSSCAMSIPFVNPSPREPVTIQEASLKSIEIKAVSLPKTRLPAASMEQAKYSYLTLMKSSKTPSLIAESLQRLAEIESMIANNMLDQGKPQQMQGHLKLAAGYYQQLLEQYPEHIDKTVIQYQLARVLELDGEANASEKILGQIAQLNGSEFEVIEAGFRMAERAYSQKRYNQALKLYNKVLLHKNVPEDEQLNSFYNAALFKRGWTQFKKQNYDLAVEDFADLLRLIYVEPKQRNTAEKTLIDETYRVTSLSLSYLNGAKSLAKYFQQNGHTGFERELYLSLADMYMEQQRFHDTATTYSTYVEFNPLSIHAPEFEHKGIEILSKSGFIDLVLTAKENFVMHYQTGANYWQQIQTSRSDKVSNWLYKNLEDVINFYHAKAQQTKKSADYFTAAKWYRIFLNSFGDHKQAYDKRWLLAESLYDAGDKQASINEYQILAYQANSLSVERKEEAGYRIILARQKLLEDVEQHQPSDKVIIDKARAALIQAGLVYKTTFNSAKRVPQVMAQTIELQLASGLTKDAVIHARAMADTKWASELNKKRSREIVANGEFDLKNYGVAEKAYTAVIEHDQYQPAKMDIFHQRRAQSIYKQAEILKQQKKYSQAVEQFLRLGQVEPTSKTRIKAEYDAATLLLEIENYGQAVVILEKFIKRNSKHPLAENIPAKLIVAYEALDNWSGAARQYERIANSSKNNEVARTATWQAATNWMKMSDITSQNTSVALWKKYIKRYPKPYDLSLEARNNLITLYGIQKIKWKQDFWRKKIIQTVDKNKRDDPRSRTLAANSQMSLSTDAFNAFKAIKLSQPLKKSLKQKRQKLKVTLAGFSKALDYRIQSISTQAGHRIGESYALLAKSIMDSERPKKLTDIELEEYEMLLEEKVYPFEDQAIEALEANISLTTSLVWDKWIQQSFNQLELLMPARYNKPEIIDDYATSP